MFLRRTLRISCSSTNTINISNFDKVDSVSPRKALLLTRRFKNTRVYEKQSIVASVRAHERLFFGEAVVKSCANNLAGFTGKFYVECWFCGEISRFETLSYRMSSSPRSFLFPKQLSHLSADFKGDIPSYANKLHLGWETLPYSQLPSFLRAYFFNLYKPLPVARTHPGFPKRSRNKMAI